MAIKRWDIESDTTISNAFQENLTGRIVSGNAGMADTLEVFTLYGQGGQGSVEISRILLKLDLDSVLEQISNNTVPAPDSENAPRYYLNLSNAAHPSTLPRNFTVSVHKLTESFDEGDGIDLDNFTDVGAASWKHRINLASSSGSGVITVIDNPTAPFKVIVAGIEYAIDNQASEEDTAALIASVLETSEGTVVTASADANEVTITSLEQGASGNYSFSVSSSTGNITTSSFYMTGGTDYTPWSESMDINSGPFEELFPIDSTLSSEFTFTNGYEDMLLDVTDYVESFIWDGISLNESIVDNFGIILKIKDESSTKSKYTKKFFSRTSEFFFKRPRLEARWDNSTKDSRNNLFNKVHYLTDEQNTRHLFLYNSIGGQLVDLNMAAEELFFSIYNGEQFDELAESPSEIVQVIDPSTGTSVDFIQAVRVSKGVYRASFIMDGVSDGVYERWYVSADGELDKKDIISTALKLVTPPVPTSTTKTEEYIYNITNLKTSYSKQEKPRFRIYARLKDWSPTIYTVASKALENETVDKLYYQIFRVADEEVVIDFGIGGQEHTLTSYDKDGNYFDFDMSMLEAGYMYAIKLATCLNGEILEHKEIFKFRVD